MTRFTDRPLRDAYVLADGAFVKGFRGYFGRIRPNAVLTYTPRGSAIPVSVVLTVGQPRWNARRTTWTFPATRIRKQPDDLPVGTVQIKPTLIPNPRSFKQATLFIDDSGPIVIDGCQFGPWTVCDGVQAQLSNLSDVDLTNADFTDADFTDANLTGANLTDATFHAATLSGANFTGANLSNSDFFGVVLDFGVLDGANLRSANLSHAMLIGASLHAANLTDADLSYVDLAGDLSHANLTGADLTGTDLSGTIFCDTTMPNGSVKTTRC